MLVVALAIGFGLSWYALTDGRLFGAAQIGPVDGLAARRLARARSLHARLPRPQRRAAARASEGVQFVATTDSDGQPLDRACRYRIDGNTPTATFWTLVPTAPDGATIARAGRPAGLSERAHRARQ